VFPECILLGFVVIAVFGSSCGPQMFLIHRLTVIGTGATQLIKQTC